MTGRPSKRFSAGLMRHRITVQSYTEVRDDYGQKVASWVDWLTSEPASYEYTGGGQSLRGRQIQEGIDAVFTVRYRDGHGTDKRVLINDEQFGIVHVRPIAGRQRYLELYCKAVV